MSQVIREILFVLVQFFANFVQAVTGFGGGPISMPPSMALVGVAEAKAAIIKILEHTKPMKHEKWVAEIVKWQEKYPLSVECDSGVNPQKIMETFNEIYGNL